MSIANKGNKHSLGIKRTNEQREASRIQHLGQVSSDEARQKMSISKMGHKEFCNQYHCKATIDGIEPETWCRQLNSGLIEFNHRSHVTILI